MPKNPTFPSLVEELPCISIQELKAQGLFNPGVNSQGTFYLTIDGERYGGNIDVFVCLKEIKYIAIDWCSKGKNYNTSVHIKTVKSNLGIGVIHYFLCPKTSKKCSKLYFSGNVLASRSWQNLYYRDQIRSKPDYAIIRLCKAFQEFDDLKNKYWSLRTKSYKGVPTRQAKRIRLKMENKRKVIHAMQQVTENDYKKEIEMVKKGS